MKLPEIEIDNQMLIATIKSITEGLTCRDIVIRVKAEPGSDAIYSQHHFETGQKLNISFD